MGVGVTIVTDDYSQVETALLAPSTWDQVARNDAITKINEEQRKAYGGDGVRPDHGAIRMWQTLREMLRDPGRVPQGGYTLGGTSRTLRTANLPGWRYRSKPGFDFTLTAPDLEALASWREAVLTRPETPSAYYLFISEVAADLRVDGPLNVGRMNARERILLSRAAWCMSPSDQEQFRRGWTEHFSDPGYTGEFWRALVRATYWGDEAPTLPPDPNEYWMQFDLSAPKPC